MSWKTYTKPGDVLRITKLVNENGIQVEDDAWGIVLDNVDMIVYVKRTRIAGANEKQSFDGWSSRVCAIDWADEDTEIAKAEEVPEDIPPDFWPLTASIQLCVR
jgi:hypothetical protein